MKLRCPNCRAERDVPDDYPHRPFCSDQCKTIDLGNWLDEAYKFSSPLNVDEILDDEIEL